ncbi:unnamed protein product [Linum trigynum]|uniref:Retrotransposon Copia-like N-terminal domain-containing protein n=1 Tax=Linum trigynum TaxID=586398 RepID=A0AAV2GWJ1_9ROSI
MGDENKDSKGGLLHTGGSSSDQDILLSSPLYLHPSEDPACLFVVDLLSDSNYGEWVNDMMETLISKNKLTFVNGSLPRSAAGPGTRVDAWDRCDATVKGWLNTAMIREVRNSVRTTSTARDIWVDLQQRFGEGSSQRSYKIQRQISALRQDKLSVSAFYTKLWGLWDEMYTISNTPRCTCSGFTCGGCRCDLAKQLRDQQETTHLFEFFVGIG